MNMGKSFFGASATPSTVRPPRSEPSEYCIEEEYPYKIHINITDAPSQRRTEWLEHNCPPGDVIFDYEIMDSIIDAHYSFKDPAIAILFKLKFGI